MCPYSVFERKFSVSISLTVDCFSVNQNWAFVLTALRNRFRAQVDQSDVSLNPCPFASSLEISLLLSELDCHSTQSSICWWGIFYCSYNLKEMLLCLGWGHSWMRIYRKVETLWITGLSYSSVCNRSVSFQLDPKPTLIFDDCSKILEIANVNCSTSVHKTYILPNFRYLLCIGGKIWEGKEILIDWKSVA